MTNTVTSWQEPMPWEFLILKKNPLILHFLSQNNVPRGWEVMKFTLITLQMLHIKFGMDWPSSS